MPFILYTFIIICIHLKCKRFQKFVCTTIRPTQLEYKELYDWDGAAEFVADYLNFETLEPSFELVCII